MIKNHTRTFENITVFLEALAHGINKHGEVKGFPREFLDEEAIRKHRSEFEEMREKYVNQLVKMKQAYKSYAAKKKEMVALLSTARSALHMTFGKKNTVLLDFGFAPHKTKAKKKRAVEAKGEAA